MTPRLWALSLAPLLAASSAYAQAPGDVSPGSYYAPPQQQSYAPAPSSPYYAPAPPSSYAPAPPSSYAPAPAPTDRCGFASSPVMARRWAIGLSVGRLGVAPEGAVEGSETRFRITELAVRYRATRRLELELAMSGGREMLEDDTEGHLATGSVTLALRYRLRPEQRWNWFVMGGFGGTVVAPHESTALEREGATRPLGMLGIGIERRFRRLALQAELRAVGLGPREDAVEDSPVVGGGGGPTMPVPRLPAGAATTYADELSGGALTLGASYYF